MSTEAQEAIAYERDLQNVCFATEGRRAFAERRTGLPAPVTRAAVRERIRR